MGKWRNKGAGDGQDATVSEATDNVKKEMKKKAKSGEPKATTANESNQAEPRQPTAPEKAMMGEDVSKKIYGQTMTSQDDKVALEAKYRDLQSGKITSKQFNEALYGSGMSQEDKLALDQSNYKGAAPARGKKGKSGGKPGPSLPEGANPDEYYTGKWRTGKKPTPAPAPEPPKKPEPGPITKYPLPPMEGPTFPGWPGGPKGPYPAPPRPPRSPWDTYPPPTEQPKFPDRGPIGGGPGQFPYPMPMPQPSWPPRGGQQPWPFPPGSQPGFGGPTGPGGMPPWMNSGFGGPPPPQAPPQQPDPRLAMMYQQGGSQSRPFGPPGTNQYSMWV